MPTCEDQSSASKSDRLEIEPAERHFDRSTTAWLIGEGVRHLHSAADEGGLAYQRVTELLRDRKDLTEAVSQLSKAVGPSDVSLRWTLLHILGDAGDASAASVFVRVAVAPLPADDERRGCESPRDGEILVRTMAVEGLQQLAGRHPQAAEQLLHIVGKAPDRALVIEAVKAASALGLQEKVRGILPKENHWMLDIRRARVDEVAADPERKDGTEHTFAPPKFGTARTTPKTSCCCPK